jgi:hypothetical protein
MRTSITNSCANKMAPIPMVPFLLFEQHVAPDPLVRGRFCGNHLCTLRFAPGAEQWLRPYTSYARFQIENPERKAPPGFNAKVLRSM